MALTGIIIETPSLVQVGLPIQVSEYDVQREINAAGAFSVSFPASQMLAKQVRSRWRVSIVEEGRTDYLLYRGIVKQRNYHVNVDGTGILTLAGYSRLYALTASSTHLGWAYDGSSSIEDIANDLTGESVTVPASASTITPTVTFNETSKLDALLKACELARYNLRETFAEDGFELVEQDDVPDSGFRFVNVQQAGPEIENAAANGLGLIADTPTIGYNGADLATRIIPIGADFDGKPLTLATSNKTAPYAIQFAPNPDATNYYYLEDAVAVELSGVVELQYVRSDVKNPSDDAGTKQAAANVLYALAAGELLKRRYDVGSFASEIANGRHIDALPGDRVRLQFRGTARTPSGFLTWQDIDQNFLIVKRRDSAGAAGVRGVSFTLAAPEVAMVIPALPDAVPIPPPPRDTPNPPPPRDDYNDPGGDGGGGDGGGGDGGGGDGGGGEDTPPFEDTGIPDPGALPDLTNPIGTGVPYQPCCAHQTDINDGARDPPGAESQPDVDAEFHHGAQVHSAEDNGGVVTTVGVDTPEAFDRILVVATYNVATITPMSGTLTWAQTEMDSPLWYSIVPAGSTGSANVVPPSDHSGSLAEQFIFARNGRTSPFEVGWKFTVVTPSTPFPPGNFWAGNDAFASRDIYGAWHYLVGSPPHALTSYMVPVL